MDDPISGLRNRNFAKQRRSTHAVEDERRKERQRQRRGRRRRHDSYRDIEDEEEEEEELYRPKGRGEEVLPRWKLCLVGAAIFLCFALLYPSVFAPMISGLFGGGGHRQQSATDRTMHPSMTGQQQQSLPQRPPPHHPGASMRMPDLQQQQQQQGGGSGFWGGKGGGSLSWMLPFYTVGVVCFLLYTLFKIMFKSKNKRQKRRQDRPFGLFDGDADEEVTEEEDDDDDEDDYDDGLKCGVRGAKLRSVQSRLRKTEKAMVDILSQLEQISAHSSQPVVDNASGTTKGPQKDSNMATAYQGEGENNGQNGPKPTTIMDDHLHQQATTAAISDEQSATVERSLRELQMLSDLCKSDQRLRRKLRDAQRQQQQKRHHSSSSQSSVVSEAEDEEEDDDFAEEEEEEEQQQEEEEQNGYNDEAAEEDELSKRTDEEEEPKGVKSH